MENGAQQHQHVTAGLGPDCGRVLETGAGLNPPNQTRRPVMSQDEAPSRPSDPEELRSSKSPCLGGSELGSRAHSARDRRRTCVTSAANILLTWKLKTASWTWF